MPRLRLVSRITALPVRAARSAIGAAARRFHCGGSRPRGSGVLAQRRRPERACRAGVAVKLNSADFQRGGFDASDASTVIDMRRPLGVDLVELSGGNYESPAMSGRSADERTLACEAYFLTLPSNSREPAHSRSCSPVASSADPSQTTCSPVASTSSAWAPPWPWTRPPEQVEAQRHGQGRTPTSHDQRQSNGLSRRHGMSPRATTTARHMTPPLSQSEVSGHAGAAPRVGVG